MADLETEAAAPDEAPIEGNLDSQPSEEETTAAADPAPTEAAEEAFFSPDQIPDSLRPIYKEMQGAFTRKTQALAEDRQKVEAYNAYLSNPLATLQQEAARMGYHLAPAGGQQAAAQPAQESLDDWEPNNWNEVVTRIRDMVRGEDQQALQQQLQPIVSEFQNLKRSQLERQLDEAVPEWRQYEDEMSQALIKHPTFANDPVGLARYAIPQEVMQSRAVQKAVSEFQKKAAASQVSSGSSTRRKPSAKPKGPLTFDEAVNFAKRELAEG